MAGNSPFVMSAGFFASSSSFFFCSSSAFCLASSSPSSSFFSSSPPSAAASSPSAGAGGFLTRWKRPAITMARGTLPWPSRFKNASASVAKSRALRTFMIASRCSGAKTAACGNGKCANSTGIIASSSVSANCARALLISAGPGVPSSGAALGVIKLINPASFPSNFISFFSPLAATYTTAPELALATFSTQEVDNCENTLPFSSSSPSAAAGSAHVMLISAMGEARIAGENERDLPSSVLR
mmetsp:Transcript_17364/g.27742  ORF Transcript_17364/g.27742 Transcript_17364/m.27742 type:complete len:242 (-) Transcript_17364:1387-2112(-)